MTKDEIKHINWMYNRLTSVHKENPNVDYMMRFKEIIDKQLTLCDVVASLPSRLEMNNQAEKEFEKMELINKTIPFKHFRLGFSTCYNWMAETLRNKG